MSGICGLGVSTDWRRSGKSRQCRLCSSRSSGRGQERPQWWNLCRYSAAVRWLIEQQRPMARSLNPCSNRNRRTSLSFRIDSLFAGMVPPQEPLVFEEGSYVLHSQRRLSLLLQGRNRPRVCSSGMPPKSGQLPAGFSGQVPPDSVDNFRRIEWTASSGFGGQIAPDYASTKKIKKKWVGFMGPPR